MAKNVHIAVLYALVLLVGLQSDRQGSGATDILRARGLEILSEEGDPVVVIRSVEHGIGVIHVGRPGVEMTTISPAKIDLEHRGLKLSLRGSKEGGGVWTFGSNGLSKVGLEVSPDGHGQVSILSKEGGGRLLGHAVGSDTAQTITYGKK